MSQTRRTLLIVDDSPEDRELYQRCLQRDGEYSYNILEATQGQQGLELWQQHQPDVVLLDYRLPDLDGLEFLIRLRSATQQPCLAVIMVTGEGNEAIAVQAMKAGAQDYLVKEHITPERLQLAVNGAIATVQLRTQLQQRIERERLVWQITQKLHQSLNLSEILQTTVTQVRQFLQTDRVLIFRLQSDGWGKVVTESVGTGWNSLLSTSLYDPCLSENYIEYFRQGQVTLKADIYEGTIDACHVEQLVKLQVRANLVVPILQHSQLWGMLIVHHCTAPRQWQPLEVDLLKELATQLGIAIQQAELYQQAQNELVERRRTEVALRDSEERFRQLAENIEAVFWVTEFPERRVSYVSPAYNRLWGLNPDELLNDQQNWSNYLHPEDREATERAFLEKAAVGGFDEEYRIVLPDGRLRWVRDRCFPIRDELGRVYRLTGIAEDITERKRHELNERFLNELEQRLRQLADAQAMLRETITSLGDYLGGNRCTLGEIDWQNSLITIEQDWCQNVPSMSGTYSLSNYITPEFQATFAAGQFAAIDDITKDPRTAAFASNYQPYHVRAFVSVPGIYQGQWVASLTIYSGTPRLWHEDEVTLLQATLARVWALIEQTRAVQALRESEARFRLVTQAVNGLVFDWNLQTNEVYRSEKLFDLVGFYPEDVPASADWWQELVDPVDLARLQSTVPKLFGDTENLYEGEYRVRHKNGHWVNVWERGSLIRNEQGQVIRIVGSTVDISDRKQAEAALRQSEERYRCLAELIPQLVWTANATGTLLDANQRWLEFTGLTLEQACAASWEQVVHPEDVPILAQKWAESVKNNTSYQAQGRMRRADRVYRWYLHQAVGQKNEQGETIKWFGTATDIEAQKQLEIERDRLLQLEQTARAEAERANRIKDEFLAILSHELRSPLNPILGWAKLLQTRKLDETKTQEALVSIERNAKLQTQLIDDLLDVAKILRGKLSMNTDPVNLGFVIEAALDTMRNAALAKSIKLHPVLTPIGLVSGDAARLQQVVWNLLSNAIKFTPNNGKVEIRLEQVGKQAQITVSDTGKGINPKFLPHIFESFRQEDASTTRKYGGLGLGLAIVRSLVESHGGTISAESKGEGQGATFTLRLPLLDTQPQKSLPHRLIKEPPDITGVRILAVDDEPDTRELLTVLLAQYGAEVLTVTSAAEVLANLESFQPHVLISDIGMPNVDGYTLIQKIRTRPPEQGGQIPAIALTAYARIEDRQRSLLAGFQHHLSKPIDIQELIKTIFDIMGNRVDC
ncbi:PAS domain-containing protein [Tolypothrix sp. FACHB-123]|uniref:PAS domain-containing protein n=1 Tax=Tolypothrix sp. FACHB-123 TaxID=2692868 RepID=UPI0016829C17|nr:PAS domain-containing protein [Tolypothrix sp. FACHB-123]MBD2356195.1 PAS domain-containing protein [Tolypothrix sp. FACHB-123]